MRSRFLAPFAALGLLAAPPIAAAAEQPQVVEITVTSEGFVPAAVTVKQGTPVKLVVTRRVERTCATEIVMRDFGVNAPLPLGKKVEVVVAPKTAGSYRFACGMNMIAGVIHVK